MFPPKLPFPVDPKIIITVVKKLWNLFFEKDQERENIKETISQKRAADVERTEINDIMELNSVLVQFSNLLQTKASEIEREIMKECAYFFEDFRELLSIFNEKYSDFTLVKIERFSRKLEKIERDIQGTMATYVSRHVSLDDETCRRILKLLPGDKKKHQMDEFERTILVDAVKEVTMKIKDEMLAFEEQLVQAIEDRMEQFDEMYEEKEEILIQLINSKQNNEQQNEVLVFNSMLTIDQAAYIYEQVRRER